MDIPNWNQYWVCKYCKLHNNLKQEICWSCDMKRSDAPLPQTSFQLDWQRLYDKVCQGPTVSDKCLIRVVERLAETSPNRRLSLTPLSEYVRNPFYEIPLTTKLSALTIHSSALLYLLRNARYLPVNLATMILEVVED